MTTLKDILMDFVQEVRDNDQLPPEMREGDEELVDAMLTRVARKLIG